MWVAYRTTLTMGHPRRDSYVTDVTANETKIQSWLASQSNQFKKRC